MIQISNLNFKNSKESIKRKRKKQYYLETLQIRKRINHKIMIILRKQDKISKFKMAFIKERKNKNYKE